MVNSNYEFPVIDSLKTVIKSLTDASPVDYVVCAHKAIDQQGVAMQLEPVVDQTRTTIVIIQNGVGNEEAFRSQFPQSSILTCVVSFSFQPWVISQTNCDRLGLVPRKSARG